MLKNQLLKFILLIVCFACIKPAYAQFNDTTQYHAAYLSSGSINKTNDGTAYLLNNAFKYSPDSKAVSIRFELTPGGQVKVLVTDYGIGIPKDNIDNIFDRFFRVEHTSQNFSGLGLGLYISSEIVKQHNGQIGVYSTLGEGSTFWFSI